MENILKPIPEEYRKYVPYVLLCAAYIATGRLGLSLYAVEGFATLVWPPTGIALAALLLYGLRFWPAIAAGAFITNLSIGATPAVAAGIALGNTLEAVIGVYVLRHYTDFDTALMRLRDSVHFIIVAGSFAPIISATIGVTSLLLGGVISASQFSLTWLAWWVGDMLGALVVGPLLLVWVRPVVLPSVRRIIEIISAGILLLIFNILIFFKPFVWLASFPFLYPLIIPLAWITLRYGIRGITLATFVTSLIAVWATAIGHGAFISSPVQEELLYLQVFIGTIAPMFLVFGSIIEERLHISSTLQTQVQKLQAALNKIQFEDEAKKEFLALLAHELRNPLAPVVSGLELIRLDKSISTTTKRVIKSMRDQTKTMVRLVDDLLDISRISQKKLQLRKKPVELNGIIRQSIKSVEPRFKNNNQHFSLKIPEKSVWFDADPVRLEQVIVNILENASKYTPPGGTISLEAKTQADEIILTIKDTGIGIPPEMLERIFEPFLQVERVRKQGAGIGIGLSLTRYLVHMHEGTIEARSKGAGHGSEFIVRIPIMRALSASKSKGPKVSAKESASGRKKVLVVDDNEAAAKTIGKLLEHNGHEVRVVYTGTDALTVTPEFSPDVVLLDIGLPDLSGYDVAKQIRLTEKPEEHRMLVALTGFGQEEDIQKSWAAGFDHHLTKPVGIAELHALLTQD